MSAGASGPGNGRRLPRAVRLTSSRDIRSILRGKRSRTPHLDVFDSASPVAHPKAGVIVPKHRHTAVERNRLKRRLREILRIEVLPRMRAHGVQADVLVRARREAYDAAFGQLRDEMVQWVERRWRQGVSSS